jgi:hypothetical protein
MKAIDYEVRKNANLGHKIGSSDAYNRALQRHAQAGQVQAGQTQSPVATPAEVV